MAKKPKVTGIKKNKANTSNRASTAKLAAQKREKVRNQKASASKNKIKTKVRPAKRAFKPYNFLLKPLKASTLVKQLPETELTRKGMTLRQLIKNTPNIFRVNAEDVVIKKLTHTKTKTGMPAISAVAYTNDRYRPMKVRRNHTIYVIGLDKVSVTDPAPAFDKPINKHRKVLVSCQCESYVFVWEYANAAHGASRIVYGNGRAPVVTNPRLATGMCKHLVAVATKIIQKGL